TKIPAETAVSTGSESQPFGCPSENRFNSAISSGQRNSSGGGENQRHIPQRRNSYFSFCL
ncbi:hypothetical protein, partial [Alistipes putredinis]|uniref:hypothetical protein n=1 Tax=Alistipes putredinis TaxID=28117 RepID=UPI0024ADE5A3